MTLRALVAVVQARLHAQRRIVLYACVAALLAGLFEPSNVAAPLFLCALLGIAMALAQSPGLHPHLDWCEQSAPLFGRELARAKALVPCVAGVLAVVVFACTQALRGGTDVGLSSTIAAAAVVAATLTALSASLRRGASRLLYVVFAALTTVAAYALVMAAHSIPGELAFCAIVAFFALRQYGEALGRYDPI